MAFPITIRPDLTVTGAAGAALATGDVITDATAMRSIAITNGLIKVDYSARTGDERGAHMLSVASGGSYVQAMEQFYGDWSFFCVGLSSVYDRATVIEASADLVRVAFQYDALSLTGFSGGGVSYRDPTGALNYAQGAVNPNWRRITSTRLVKNILVQRGALGYFAGWQSDPYIGLPHARQAAADGETTDYGEREFGDGGGNAVMFASSGRVARWPAWYDDADGRWTANGLAATSNKIWWAGIKDPYYAPYNSAAWIAVQGAGYPSMQTSGPYWMAGIHNSIPVVRFVASRIPREFGGWLSSVYGAGVSHFNNEDRTAAGRPNEHQVFIGAIPYVADSTNNYANEPSSYLQERINEIVDALEWPTS